MIVCKFLGLLLVARKFFEHQFFSWFFFLTVSEVVGCRKWSCYVMRLAFRGSWSLFSFIILIHTCWISWTIVSICRHCICCHQLRSLCFLACSRKSKLKFLFILFSIQVKEFSQSQPWFTSWNIIRHDTNVCTSYLKAGWEMNRNYLKYLVQIKFFWKELVGHYYL